MPDDPQLFASEEWLNFDAHLAEAVRLHNLSAPEREQLLPLPSSEVQSHAL